ncbi:ribonuclease III [Massiliimalia massiliensis]|uniref:ribonuclease III n=1 Tax=Massiliimalia massiliensis TaxID=1852384 RepID=UPI0009840E84|nr:ribonuclease III [Massiliimalia massiliensis]MBS1473352.1 ribonuclease III [Massiliimalia sp.]
MLDFEKMIQYHYHNKSWMKEALTHPSYANEGKKHLKNNQRLEFLGDSVLSIIVAQHLFEHYTHLPEGELTKLRASLVCEKSLHQFALKINLGEYLILGKGEEMTGGRERPSILADAFEAVIASIYLDSGLDEARNFVLRFIPEKLDVKKITYVSDYKTALQEIIQKNREEKIEYVLVEEKGPDHNKTFMVEVHLNSNVIGTGIGRSKKQAEQIAAKEALGLMGYET